MNSPCCWAGAVQYVTGIDRKGETTPLLATPFFGKLVSYGTVSTSRAKTETMNEFSIVRGTPKLQSSCEQFPRQHRHPQSGRTKQRKTILTNPKGTDTIDESCKHALESIGVRKAMNYHRRRGIIDLPDA